MAAAATIAGLWVAFAASHMLLSSARLRPRLVRAWGAAVYQIVFSLVALALFVPLVWVYFTHKHAGPLFWYAGALPGVRWLVYGGMGLAFVLAIGGLLQPSPAGTGPRGASARGALRISRHPLFMGVGLFGAVHLLGPPVNASELAFFAGFPVFALLGCHHQDLRKLAGSDEGFRRFHAETAFLPFSRRGTLRGLMEMPLALALGLGAAVVIRTWHATLFG